MKTRTLAVMVTIETDDELLWPDRLDTSTAAKAAKTRRAVIQNLPNLRRVIMVTSEEMAKLMLVAHAAVLQEIGAEPDSRPPDDYVPPTRE